MQSSVARFIERLRHAVAVPVATLAYAGLALALFTSDVDAPAKRAAPPSASAFRDEAEPREIRKIAMTEAPQLRDVAPVPAAPVVAPAQPVVAQAKGKVGTGEPAQPAAKAASDTSPRRPASARRTVEAAPVPREQRMVQRPAKVEARPAPARVEPGVFGRTLALGSDTVSYAVGGARYAGSATVRLGRTVVGVIDDLIPGSTE